MKRVGWLVGIAVFSLLSAAMAQQQDRRTKVLTDRTRVEASGFWLYNDVAGGLAKAKQTGKPLLVVFRCIPCEHCAQLDEQLVERDPLIQKLLEQFVCVRVITTNGMDLSLFQYDYDQSWAAFFLNADRTIYGRYGTRSHRTESADDVTLAGFSKALQAALEIHRQYQKNKAALAGKQSLPVEVKSPEQFPNLSGKYKSTIDYEGQVVQSCIHCHMVNESLRLTYRNADKPIPDEVMYPYPNPKIFGLIVDPATKSTLKSVRAGSSGEKDGFKAGDEIATVEGQPILSTADIQWVLQHAGPTGSLKVQVRRAGKTVPLTLTLAPGWRQRDDLSWRASSWDLRRMTLGGMQLEAATPEQRRAGALADGALALRVKSEGQSGPHGVAKQSGFQVGDVLVAIKGRSDNMTESDAFAYLAQQTRAGDKVPFTVLRGGQRVDLTLPMQ